MLGTAREIIDGVVRLEGSDFLIFFFLLLRTSDMMTTLAFSTWKSSVVAMRRRSLIIFFSMGFSVAFFPTMDPKGSFTRIPSSGKALVSEV